MVDRTAPTERHMAEQQQSFTPGDVIDAASAYLEAVRGVDLAARTRAAAMAASNERLEACRLAFLNRHCTNHPGQTIRDILDGEPLCQSCCDAWARSEGAALASAQAAK